MALSPEEAIQRNREVQAALYKKRKEKIAQLVEAGLLVKLTRGRKRLYTPEEAYEVAKRQRRESALRSRSRLNDAKALLVQVVPEEA